jgi:hypothetical protein
MSSLHRLLPCLLAALVLPPGAARAQAPTGPELVAALATSEPQAGQMGMVWRTQLLWLEALRQRSPLVAAYHQGVCHLGYSAYTPGQDFRWLFPALAPAQRASWLAGMVQHELAHCAEQAAGAAGSPATVTSQQQQEVLADLAFALHVDHAGAEGLDLVALLAALRSHQAGVDPTHDTADALRCYQNQRVSFKPEGTWLARLQAWRTRCGQPQASSPQPVATRR